MDARNFDIGRAEASRARVGWWLLVVAAIIIAMVTLGGLTRLTGSGLSITEWKPVTGVVPPLSEQQWSTEFEKYRHIPQYVHENRGMDLAGFKAIYWWEWTHRLLGRLIGIVFFVPFVYFAATGVIGRRQVPRMILLFALGGLQGAVGWWMVQSGLETRVSVSQYRLAIHLGVAIILLGAILWTALDYLRGRENISLVPTKVLRMLQVGGIVFAALVYLQMLLGALVAGLHAGLIYNTWPSMDGRAFPEGAFVEAPWWLNFFENPGLAQFDHRIGAYIVAASAVALWFSGRRARLSGVPARSANAVLHVALFQIVLGIGTLLMQAPIALAVLHQLTAALLFCAAVWHAYELRRTYASASA